MIDQKKRRILYRPVNLMAVAVLSAALLAGQARPTLVRGGSSIEVSSLIPDNVTIDKPVELSEISLPKSEYGKLAWADDSQVPSKRIESFEVIFTPNGSADLSGLSGWDSDKGKLYGYVTVIVCSLEADEQDADGESSGENAYEETEELNEAESPDASQTGGIPADDEASEPQASPDVTEVPSDNTASEPQAAPEVTEIPQGGTGAGIATEPGVSETPAGTGEVDAAVTPGVTEIPADVSDIPDTPGSSAASEGNTGAAAPEETETPDAPENPEVTEAPEVTPEITDSPDNIFDKTDEMPEEDTRPIIAGTEMTLEEQAEMAETNHCSNGIYVSGIDLPWYVQFRVTSGEKYEFSNEKEAGIFKSYEFVLWDLRNDTEYEIPDGGYISVTLPVKAGYEYTVEHLLDNGAKETIIPSVNGSTMVFSTHSFSPFGIAGSKPIVGGDIIEEGYKPASPTPTPTKAPAVTQKPVATQKPTVTQTSTGNTSGGNNSQSGSSGQPSGSSANSNINTGAANGNSSYNSGSNSGNSSTRSDSSSTSADQNTGRYVNTGDNTQILPFIILVVAAVIAAGAVIYLKKRK